MSVRKLTSIKDVAKAAGVSVTTVSRYLNRTLDLPLPTRTRIDEAIKSLDYRPNPHARRLSRGRAETIGLVVPDISNPFFATLVAAVEEEADRRSLAVSLHATLNRPGREITYLQLIEHNHVDGLIFATNHHDDGLLAPLINRTGKVVVVDEDVPGALVPKILCDNENGGYLVGQHLAANAHRRVLFVGGSPEMLSAHRRRQGLSRALNERFGDDAELTAYAGDYTVDYGREAARRFLREDRPGSAIFASSDEIAIGLIEVFKETAVSVPEDVSVVGFDDVSPLHLFAPPITTVRQPVREIGKRALEVLLETNWQDPGSFASEELLPVEIVVRNSVAPPAKP